MKKIISGFLGILFVVLVVIGIIVSTYAFSQPSKEGDSRSLISGPWTDEDANVTFVFSTEGNFTMKDADDGDIIAKGWFKINEDDKQVKLLILPTDRDDSVDIGLTLGFFSTLSYRDLSAAMDDTSVAKDFQTNTDEDELATCKFLFKGVSDVYNCERTETNTDFYNGKTN